MKKILYSLSTLILIVLVSGYYLIGTTGGLGLLIALANRVVDAQISAEVESGSLYRGFELRDIEVIHDTNSATLSFFSIDWHLPDILSDEIRISSLSLQDVSVVIEPQRITDQQGVEMPVIPGLSVERISLENLSIMKPDMTEIFRLDRIQGKLQLSDNTLLFNDFYVSYQNLSKLSNGSVELRYPYAVSAVSDISYNYSDNTRFDGRISIDGSLTELLTQVELPEGTATITVINIDSEPVWSADVSLSQFRPDQINNSLPEIELNLELVVNGTTTEAAGTSSISVNNPQSADAFLLDEIDLVFDTRLDPENSIVTFNDLSVTGGDVSLHSSGRYNIQNNRFSIRLDWQDLSIYLEEIDEYIRVSGNTTLDGTLDSFGINTIIELSGDGNIPSTTMTASGNGNLDGLQLDSLEFGLLEGTIAGELEASWGNTRRINFGWRGDGLNPGVVWPEWSGDLAASGDVLFSSQNDIWTWSAESIQVSGELKGSPLRLSLSGNSVGTGGVNIEANANYTNLDISFHGQAGDELDINWEVNSPDLSLLDGSLGGLLTSSGHISGTTQNPVIDAEILADGVITPWGRARTISAAITSGTFSGSDISADITLEEVNAGEVGLDSMHLVLIGYKESHEFSFNASLPELEVTLAGRGNYVEPVWTGQIDSLETTHAELDSWTLDGPARVSFSPDEIASEQLCLRYSQGSVCMQGRYRFETQDWVMNADSNQIPLSLLQSNLPGSPELTGRGDFSLQASGQGTRPDGGNVSFDITDGSVVLPDRSDAFQNIPLSGSHLQVELEQGTLKGSAQLPAINENFTPVNATIEISGYDDLKNLPVDKPLSGDLRAGGNDLSLLTVLSPELESLAGNFDLDIKFSGTMLEPLVQGRAEIREASFSFLDLGIEITNINLTGTNTAGNRYDITGQLQSGDGIVQMQANIQRFTEEGIEVGAQLSGENFELVNLPELWAIVNPSINSRLTLTDQYFEGDISVPAAIIDLDEAAIAASISADEIVDGKKTIEQTTDVNQYINVNISLGDNVQIRGMGITGKLTGGLFLSNVNTNSVLVADGEIAINNGRYSAYGQQLAITEGRLIYNKVSLENPTIALTASRNVDDITVGLSVSGYVSSPVVTLFSSSNLPQEEILSYIVFGRALNTLTSGEGQDLIGAATAMGISKSGLVTEKLASMFGLDQLSLSGSTTQNASIVVGKYINPRLYLSYGLGIIDKISTAKLNYRLSNRFSLEAQRGLETGFDLFYNLER